MTQHPLNRKSLCSSQQEESLLELELKKLNGLCLGIRLEAEEIRSEVRGHLFQILLRILSGFQGKARGANVGGRKSLQLALPTLFCQPHSHLLRKAQEVALGMALPLHIGLGTQQG